MANIGEYCIAELVLLTLLSKYPNFIEGWVVANLFYLKIENYEGAQVSLQTGEIGFNYYLQKIKNKLSNKK